MYRIAAGLPSPFFSHDAISGRLGTVAETATIRSFEPDSFDTALILATITSKTDPRRCSFTE